MGWKLFNSEVIAPLRNDDVNVEVILNKEYRSIIHGTVKALTPQNFYAPVKEGLVKIFLKHHHNLIPVQWVFTDKNGHFMFYVEGCKEYVIKAFYFDKTPFSCGCDRHNNGFIIDDSIPVKRD